jgi:[ribosomal protein S18]-alanine N-acetyltransferase
VKIRKATADDIRSIMDLARVSATAAHWTEQQYRDLLTPAAAAHRLVVVAEAGGNVSNSAASHNSERLLGFLIARFLTPECELENIVVSAAARRRGVGKGLLNALLVAARETNSESVFLEVRESNQAARAFYEQAEFKLDGRRKSYYSNPSEDAILYRLAVGVK